MKLALVFCCCVLLYPLTTLAAGSFNYNYVDLGYQHQVAPGEPTLTGPNLDLSWTVYNELQIIGGYGQLSASSPDVSNHDYSIGIRGDTSFSEQTDFTTDILYLYDRSTISGNTGTDNGYRLALGFRHLFNQWLELDGDLGHNWLNQSSNDASLGLLFNATSWLATGLSYSHNGITGNTANVSVRFYF